MIPEHFRLKNTIKYPTSLIVGGLSRLGLEIADSLIEQGGYVIIADEYSQENIEKLNIFASDSLVSFIDYTTLATLDEDLRRLDYIFYFNHESTDYLTKVSTQEFLKASNSLDISLSLANKFESRFLLSTSMRAHQLSITYDDLSSKYGVGLDERHSTYTDLEIQKYCENLVIEYVEKTKLDARIVRLGEVIGEGIDFTAKTFFTKLVLNVASNQPLILSKDGLESEWMVHLMDAAYGIIKAQFSKDTNGKIFSLSYPNPFTHITLAYKIQELEPDTKEIQFIESENNLPEIRLYKPASNLMEIGWTPKVPIDKAITQSVAAAKIFLLEIQSKTVSDESVNVVNKLRGFLTLAEKDHSSESEYGGPISRLVAERKRQEESKPKAVESFDHIIKERSAKRKTIKEEATDKIWNASIEAGNSISHLKKKSPFSLIKISFFTILAIFIFVFIFSPVVSIGKDVIAILPFYNTTINSIQTSAYSGTDLHADILSSALKDIDQNMESFKNIISPFGLESNYLQVRATISSYSMLAEGLEDIQYALDPFYEYLNSYTNNLELSDGVESYIKVSATPLNYSVLLSEFQSRTPYLDSGIEKYKKGLQQAEAINYEVFPAFISERLRSLNYRLIQNEEILNSLKSAKNIPELFGINSPKTYLILLEDNSRIKPIGGEISAFLLVTFNNGGITEAIIQTPEQLDLKFSEVTSSTLSKINQRKFTSLTKENLTLQDFSLIYDYPEYSKSMTKLFEDNFKEEISAIVKLNYTALADLLLALNSKNVKVNINETEYSGEYFFEQLAEPQNKTESLSTKHELSAKIYSSLFQELFSNLQGTSSEVLTSLNSSISNQDLFATTSGLSYDSYVLDNDLDRNQLINKGYSIGYNITDPKIVYPDKNPNFEVQEEVRVDSKDILTYKLNLIFRPLGASQEISLCIPNEILNSDINVKSIESSRVVINNGLSEKCVVVKILKEKTLEIGWKSKSKITTIGSVSRVEIPSRKVNGTNSELIKKIIIEPDLKLQNSQPQLELQNNTLIYKQNFSKDINFILEYTKL